MSSGFLFERLGLAILLGCLVGIQRQKSQSHLAGFRTFPLITLWGSFCALLSQAGGSVVLAIGIVAVIALLIIGNIVTIKKGEELGLTTEVASLVMYGVGAYLVLGQASIAVAAGGAVAILLQFKPQLHGFADRLGDQDLNAIMRFVLLAFIILPILPNEEFGPFEVINPYEIWLMVVFIVGLNLIGYIISKFIGSKAGIITSGLLGGLISSTATTVSFAKSSRNEEKSIPAAAIIILIASTFAYVRVVGEVAAISKALLPLVALRLGVLFALSFLFSGILYLMTKATMTNAPKPKEPGEVKAALFFSLTYIAVVLATAAAKKYLGPSSFYWVAGLSGLTDVDAITLSTSRLVADEKLEVGQASNMILVATMSNLAFKLGIVAIWGNRKLFRTLLVGFGAVMLAGWLLLLF